jgi:hypothetical protein
MPCGTLFSTPAKDLIDCGSDSCPAFFDLD